MSAVHKYFSSSRLSRILSLIRGTNQTKQSTKFHSSSYKRRPFKQKNLIWKITFGITSVACLYYSYGITRVFLLNKYNILSELPQSEISKKVVGTSPSHQALKLVLYEQPSCPHCSKVKTVLDYYGLSYDVVEVNPLRPTQLEWTQQHVVPNLLVKIKDGYIQLTDSSAIISALVSYLHTPNQNFMDVVNYYPFSEKDAFEHDRKYTLMYAEPSYVLPTSMIRADFQEEADWRLWADKVLITVVGPNIYRNMEEAVEAFQWFSQVGEWDRLFPLEENVLVYSSAFRKWRTRRPLEEPRLTLYVEANRWMNTIKAKKTPFLGGDTPNLADLAVYGIFNMIEGCSAFKDVVENTTLGEWYFPLKKLIESRKGKLHQDSNEIIIEKNNQRQKL